MQNYFPVLRCPEGKGKGQKPVLAAFCESLGQGRPSRMQSALPLDGAQMEHAVLQAEPCWVPPLQAALRSPFGASSAAGILLSSAGSRLWAQQGGVVVTKHCQGQSCDICACSSCRELKGGGWRGHRGAWGWMAHRGLQPGGVWGK